MVSPVKKNTGGIIVMWIRITDESDASVLVEDRTVPVEERRKQFMVSL